MSLEQSINELNTNIVALIAALTNAPVQPLTSDQHLEKAAEHVSAANEQIKQTEPKAESKVEDQPAAAAEVTEDDCKQITLKLAAKKGRDAAVAVLAEFGVSKAGELKADQRAEYLAAATAALEA